MNSDDCWCAEFCAAVRNHELDAGFNELVSRFGGEWAAAEDLFDREIRKGKEIWQESCSPESSVSSGTLQPHRHGPTPDRDVNDEARSGHARRAHLEEGWHSRQARTPDEPTILDGIARMRHNGRSWTLRSEKSYRSRAHNRIDQLRGEPHDMEWRQRHRGIDNLSVTSSNHAIWWNIHFSEARVWG